MTRWPGASEELSDFASVVEELARDRLAPHVQETETTDALPAAVVGQLAANDLWSVGLPDADLDLDPRAVVVAVAELAAVLPAAALAVAHVHLLGLAAGDLLGGLTSVRGGARVTCVAGSVGDGDPVAMHLERARALGGAAASFAVVIGPRRVAVLDEAAWSAARIDHIAGQAGLRGAPSVAVDFDAEIAADRVGGAEPKLIRARSLLLLSSLAAGIVTASAADAATYAAERQQFGRSIDTIAVVAAKLLAAREFAADLRLRALVAADGGASEIEPLAREAVRGLVDEVGECLQVLGGYGYLDDYPLARAMRDAISVHALLLGALALPIDLPVAA